MKAKQSPASRGRGNPAAERRGVGGAEAAMHSSARSFAGTRFSEGPEGRRKLAGGANHRLSVRESASPGRGVGIARRRRPVPAAFAPPHPGLRSSLSTDRWLAPPANFRRPSGPDRVQHEATPSLFGRLNFPLTLIWPGRLVKLKGQPLRGLSSRCWVPGVETPGYSWANHSVVPGVSPRANQSVIPEVMPHENQAAVPEVWPNENHTVIPEVRPSENQSVVPEVSPRENHTVVPHNLAVQRLVSAACHLFVFSH